MREPICCTGCGRVIPFGQEYISVHISRSTFILEDDTDVVGGPYVGTHAYHHDCFPSSGQLVIEELDEIKEFLTTGV